MRLSLHVVHGRVLIFSTESGMLCSMGDAELIGWSGRAQAVAAELQLAHASAYSRGPPGRQESRDRAGAGVLSLGGGSPAHRRHSGPVLTRRTL